MKEDTETLPISHAVFMDWKRQYCFEVHRDSMQLKSIEKAFSPKLEKIS